MNHSAMNQSDHQQTTPHKWFELFFRVAVIIYSNFVPFFLAEPIGNIRSHSSCSGFKWFTIDLFLWFYSVLNHFVEYHLFAMTFAGVCQHPYTNVISFEITNNISGRWIFTPFTIDRLDTQQKAKYFGRFSIEQICNIKTAYIHSRIMSDARNFAQYKMLFLYQNSHTPHGDKARR